MYKRCPRPRRARALTRSHTGPACYGHHVTYSAEGCTCPQDHSPFSASPEATAIPNVDQSAEQLRLLETSRCSPRGSGFHRHRSFRCDRSLLGSGPPRGFLSTRQLSSRLPFHGGERRGAWAGFPACVSRAGGHFHSVRRALGSRCRPGRRGPSSCPSRHPGLHLPFGIHKTLGCILVSDFRTGALRSRIICFASFCLVEEADGLMLVNRWRRNQNDSVYTFSSLPLCKNGVRTERIQQTGGN